MGVGCWRRMEVRVIRERAVEAIIVDIEVSDGRAKCGTRPSVFNSDQPYLLLV